MTFLLQKFNAISRSCTEVRARNGLRPTASGIAFTGRLAVVCLLLAGFLGVGSAMAQVPHVLRMGDGSISVAIGGNEVHHYLIDTDGDGKYDDEMLSAAGTDPTGRGGTTMVNTFLVGGIALATWTDADPNTLMITPVSTGGFKVATSPMGDEDLTTEAGSNNMGTPYAFVVMSGNAPMLIGTANNAAVQADMEALELTPRDDTSKKYDLLDWFSDPNDIFLTFTAEADPAKFCKPTGTVAGNDREPCGATKDVAVATATIATGSSDLTVALTKGAKGGNDSSGVAIWVFAHDSNGEYARKQINLTVGTSTNPYVDKALTDVVLREDDATNTEITLSDGLMDPDAADATRIACGDNRDMPVNECSAQGLEYSVTINDAAAAKVGSDTEFTWVTSYMTAAVVQGAAAAVEIRPRAPGSATFTVTATDKGLMCKAGFRPAYLADHDNNPVTPKVWAHATDIPINPATPAGLPSVVTKCLDMTTGGRTTALADQKLDDLFPNAKSVSDAITVTIVTKTSPKADKAIPAQTVVADKEAIMVDLEDLNGDKDGEPAAFEDPTKEGLTYTAVAAQVKGDDIATVTVEGSMVTIAPIWRAGGASTTVTVKATNNLDEESLSSTFGLTVKTATLPVVNMSPLVRGVLATGFKLATGGDPMVIPLANLTGATKAPFLTLFIDPNANPKDALPGGLLYQMRVADVVADHVYENQSKTNDVTTSAMRLVLDPWSQSHTDDHAYRC